MRNASSSSPAPSSALDLSAQLAAAVKASGGAVVGVAARRRMASSGIVWTVDGSAPAPGSAGPTPSHSGAPAASPAGSAAVVVTADHTVEREEDIAVLLPDGRRVPAILAGRDPATDLAALRVEDSDLAALAAPEWSDLSGLELGHLVLTLARPGHHLRAGLGVVSDLRPGWRTPGGGRIDRYLEAEGGLERGFSGSLLVDVRGRALGLNTRGLLRSRAIALPAATIGRVVESLLAHGRVRRGFLGIGAAPVRLPARLAQELGRATALMVLAVEPGSPAERAGLLLGDVLLAFDGQPVADVGQLHARLQEQREGAAAELELLRAGELRKIAVTLGER